MFFFSCVLFKIRDFFCAFIIRNVFLCCYFSVCFVQDEKLFVLIFSLCFVQDKRCWIGPVNPATVFILCPSVEAALDFASLFFIFTSARISKLIQSRLTFLSVTMLSCVSDVIKSFYIFISYHLLHLAYISLTVPFVKCPTK